MWAGEYLINGVSFNVNTFNHFYVAARVRHCGGKCAYCVVCTKASQSYPPTSSWWMLFYFDVITLSWVHRSLICSIPSTFPSRLKAKINFVTNWTRCAAKTMRARVANFQLCYFVCVSFLFYNFLVGLYIAGEDKCLRNVGDHKNNRFILLFNGHKQP